MPPRYLQDTFCIFGLFFFFFFALTVWTVANQQQVQKWLMILIVYSVANNFASSNFRFSQGRLFRKSLKTFLSIRLKGNKKKKKKRIKTILNESKKASHSQNSLCSTILIHRLGIELHACDEGSSDAIPTYSISVLYIGIDMFF